MLKNTKFWNWFYFCLQITGGSPDVLNPLLKSVTNLDTLGFCPLLKGSDNGVMHFEESCFRTLKKHWTMDKVLKQDSSCHPITVEEPVFETLWIFNTLKTIDDVQQKNFTHTN
jgi:hypothetical protein